jgi:signal peptidase II
MPKPSTPKPGADVAAAQGPLPALTHTGFFGSKSLAMAFCLGIALVVLAVDLWTKALAVTHLQVEGNSLPVLADFFHFTLRYNHGAAFSFLYNAGGWQRWFFSGIALVMSVVIVIWLWRTTSLKRLEPLALSLILGGALGNLYDRVTLGYVVDFLHVFYRDYHFPAFNIADSGITCGAALLIWDAIRQPAAPKAEAS